MESVNENVTHSPVDIPLFKNKNIEVLLRSYVALIVYKKGDESFKNSLKSFWCGRKICFLFFR